MHSPSTSPSVLPVKVSAVSEMELYKLRPNQHCRLPDPSDEGFDALLASVEENGIQEPILLDMTRTILHGHEQFVAALELGLETVPTRVVWNLSSGECYLLALGGPGCAELRHTGLQEQLEALEAKAAYAEVAGQKDAPQDVEMGATDVLDGRIDSLDGAAKAAAVSDVSEGTQLLVEVGLSNEPNVPTVEESISARQTVREVPVMAPTEGPVVSGAGRACPPGEDKPRRVRLRSVALSRVPPQARRRHINPSPGAGPPR